jgi:tetratricopeptide (TPR) repeat protein
MSQLSFLKPALFSLIIFLLIGCKSDAERVEEYFQSGMELLESGDVDRAIVQFRNVFQFEPNHRETRMTLGNIHLERNNPNAAARQFLRVAEQYPDDFEARRNLAELAFGLSNWEEFDRHGAVAVEMRPEEPRVQVIAVGLEYRNAILDDDDPARQALTTRAETLLETHPDSIILNRLLADSYERDGRINDVLERIDALIAQTPDDLNLYMRRLGILNELQDLDGMETLLQEMVSRFPENEEVQRMLLRFYVVQQRLDDAETFLRQVSDPAAEDPGMFLTLVNFLSRVHGDEAARAELQRAIEVSPNPARFRGMVATMDFQAGARDSAIAEMENILDGADLAREDIQDIKIRLARMLNNVGNQVGARRHVEEVLAQNPSNVDALKMQAAWQLQADEVEQALSNLRIALDPAPEDIQVMDLLYETHVRLGQPDLARDYLAQAVQASGNAPETSLRYARLLIQEERYLPAEDVLLPALRQAPQNLELLGTLGEISLRLGDVPRATQVIDTLRRLDTEQSRRVANALQIELLNRQNGTDAALSFLETLADAEDAGVTERLALMRARLQMNETEDALQIARELVDENPDNPGLREALAVTLDASGETEAARTALREVVADNPQTTSAWLRLSGIAQRLEGAEAADAVIEEGLAATGDSMQLLWARASLREQTGDIDGAISIYEDLYARNSSSLLFANNLASLLVTYRDDPESLERAWTVGRRLRDADNPMLQDTYGWLLYRRGNYEEALPYLESAAEALEDPIVAAHLGFTYAALERDDEALAQLERAVALAGPADTRERIEAARAEISRLRALPNE